MRCFRPANTAADRAMRAPEKPAQHRGERDRPRPSSKSGGHGIRHRLSRGIGAEACAMLLRIAMQLALVPILIRAWGVDLYQDWLIVFSASALLATLDFGMQLYFGNLLLIAWSRDEPVAYRRAISNAMMLYACVLACAVAALAVSAFIVPWASVLSVGVMNARDVLWTGGLLAGAGLSLIPLGVVTAIYRARGDYALSIGVSVFGDALRGIGVCVAALLGAGPGLAAGAYTIVALLTWLVVGLDQRKRYGEFPLGLTIPTRREFHDAFLRSGLYAVHFAMNPIVTNAPVILLGAAGLQQGAVAVFAVTRTLVGFARQIVAQPSLLVGMEMGRLHSVQDGTRLRRVFLDASRMMSGAAGMIVGCLLVVAEPLIRIWTHGAIRYDSNLVMAFFLFVMLNTPGQVAYNIYQFTNRPGILAVAGGGYAIGTVVFCLLLIGKFSAAGAAAATGLAEFLTLGVILPFLACRDLAISFPLYITRSYAIAATGFAISYGIARGLDTLISGQTVVNLAALGIVWAIGVCIPAFFLLFAAESRSYLTNAIRLRFGLR
jgi:O-antigen/teichoic acid export membrane protein